MENQIINLTNYGAIGVLSSLLIYSVVYLIKWIREDSKEIKERLSRLEGQVDTITNTLKEKL